MAYPKAGAHPDYTNTGSKFIPEIWSGKILKKFYDYTLLSKITNTDYEGEIKKMGDTVIIRSLATVSISDYIVGQALSYEKPTSTPTSLSIDKGKYWALELDDVMKVQSDIQLFSKWTEDAAMQMKISVETAFLADVYTSVHASNKGATAGVKSSSINLGASAAPLQITKTNVLDVLIDCGTVLDEANIPETGRWMVIPTWMSGLIKKSDLKDASLTGDPKSPIRNGLIGAIDRFTLYNSNLVDTTADGSGHTAYNIMFGTNEAITFATQLTETETIRSQDTFADRMRGLQIYGYKVVQPTAYGLLYAYK